MNLTMLLRSLCLWLALGVCASPLHAATELEQAVFEELNLARTNPAAYVKHLQAYRARFKDKIYSLPGSDSLIRTKEGTSAIDEAIAVLQQQQPVARLQWAEWLAKSGKELIRQQGKGGNTGHGEGAYGMEQRISRHGAWLVTIGENIAYGPYAADRGREVIIQLIVDDGVPGRGHRKNIYTDVFRQAGVACGPHPKYDTGCVIDFSGGGTAK